MIFKNSFPAYSDSVKTQAEQEVVDNFSEMSLVQNQEEFLNIQYNDLLKLHQDTNGNFEKQTNYLSSPIQTDFNFNAFGIKIKADIPEQTQISLQVRTSVDSQEWRKWQTVWDSAHPSDEEENSRDDGTGVVSGKKGAYEFSDLFFPDQNQGKNNFWQYQVRLSSQNENTTPVLDEIIFEYLNTLNQKSNEVSKVQAAGTIPSVISRAGWGADESWMTWTPEYATPENFYIHHTVTSNNDQDPAATVRAIYYYHAITKGWGDIGYNYLIDQQGQIYEGRTGGNGVIGGHVFGYNAGSIGVSLLGDFTNVTPTSAALNSLEDLSAYYAYINNINPLGTWVAGGDYPGVKPNIAGHRDSGATACPGNKLYNLLNSVRQNTYNKYQELKIYKIVKAEGGDRVYLLIEGENQIRWIPTPDIFDAWGFSWDEIETIDLSPYSEGPVLYDLAQGSQGQVFWVDAGARHWIPNAETFDAWGFDWNKISTLPNLILEKYPESFNLTRLITDSGSKVYLLNLGTKFWIENPIAFSVWGFQWTDINKISDKKSSEFLDSPQNINFLIKIDNQQSPNYLVDQQKYYPISNPDVFTAWGFEENQFQILNSNLINQYLNSSNKGLSNLAVLDNKVYLIDLVQRRHIPDPGIFSEWGFAYEDIFPVSDVLLEGIFPEKATNLTVLATAQGDSKVYLIDNAKKYWIVSPEEFSRRGFKWEDIRILSPNLLNSIETEEITGFLVKKESDPSKVYFKDELGLHHIPNPDIFDAWGFSWDDIITVSDSAFEQTALSFPLHLLVMNQGGSKVYFVNSQKIQWIPNPDVFDAWGFDWNKISVVSTEFLNNQFQTSANLSVLINPNDANLYLLTKGELRHLSLNVFDAWGFDWNEITILPLVIKNFLGLNSGDALTKLGNEYGKVYVIDRGIKHYIPSPQIFGDWGFEWGAISLDADNVLSQKSQGEDVPYIANKVDLTSDQGLNLRASDNVLLAQTAANKFVHIARLNNNYLASAAPDFFRFDSAYFRVNSDSGIVQITSYNDIPSWNPSLNDNKFRGTIEVQYSGTSNKLWAINELSLEDYLKGIAEASSTAPYEHLKTMSVAARSYAYYHISHGGKHPGEPFHLKNSRNGNGDDQVYKGYGLESRWPELTNAVNQTSGQVVTYSGNPVITPYFSHTDGRTRSWSEVWGGDGYPWLVSVLDPDCNGMTLLGHGVGLSGYGATKRAERGNSYQTILGYYYSGSGIGNFNNPNIRIAIYGI